MEDNFWMVKQWVPLSNVRAVPEASGSRGPEGEFFSPGHSPQPQSGALNRSTLRSAGARGESGPDEIGMGEKCTGSNRGGERDVGWLTGFTVPSD